MKEQRSGETLQGFESLDAAMWRKAVNSDGQRRTSGGSQSVYLGVTMGHDTKGLRTQKRVLIDQQHGRRCNRSRYGILLFSLVLFNALPVEQKETVFASESDTFLLTGVPFVKVVEERWYKFDTFQCFLNGSIKKFKTQSESSVSGRSR